MASLENARIGRRQYLVTYSKADSQKFPTRESFGKMLEDEFNSGNSKVKIEHWVCGKESHAQNGFHYHCALKLTGVKKWLSVKNNIQRKHDIVTNFSDSHNYYISAYRYVCKTDEYVFHSVNHPDLSEVGSPQNKNNAQKHTDRLGKGRQQHHNNRLKQHQGVNNLVTMNQHQSVVIQQQPTEN